MIDRQHLLASLADSRGRFKILALDHVNGLKKKLAVIGGVASVPDDHIVQIKSLIIKAFIQDVSGILLDRDALDALKHLIPVQMGILLKLDDGWTADGSGARITKVFSENCVSISKAKGACGVKLMLYYRHDAPPRIRRVQQDIVRRVGKQCRESGMLFCLEPWWYPLYEDERGDTPEAERTLAERRSDLVIRPLEEFSKPEYGVDVFKLDFPVDLRYVRDFNDDTSKNHLPLYDLETARKLCSRIGSLVKVPWTVMSSGVSAEQFQTYLTIGAAGALQGYVCGQAFWGDAIQKYPDFKEIANTLKNVSLPRLKMVNRTLEELPR